jgi:hypothetical protein
VNNAASFHANDSGPLVTLVVGGVELNADGVGCNGFGSKHGKNLSKGLVKK